MSEKNRIACFFTAGYTELNAMKTFMKKINDQVEYIQLCPCGTRRSKTAIRDRHINSINEKQNGLTGMKLIDFIVDFVKSKRFQEEGYRAILIEDDKDDRFLLKQDDGTGTNDESAWNHFKEDIISRIREQCPDLPIVFFYAAPEVEAWFLADFDNSFGSVYGGTYSTDQNNFFKEVFRKYINDNILTPKYKDRIEQYGYFDGTYRKLSAQIQNALMENDFLEGYQLQDSHPTVRYSKKLQGEEMLRRIDPIIVMRRCNLYFKEGFIALRQI